MKRGFTLVEVMTVVAIIGIVVSIAVPNVVRVMSGIRKKQVLQDLDMLSTAIVQQAMDTGKWPTTYYGYKYGKLNLTIANTPSQWNEEVTDLTDLYAGLQNGGSVFGVRWDGPYIEDIPLDPWGNKYWFDPDYTIKGGKVVAVVGSFGPNGVGVNGYDSDDIFMIIGKWNGGIAPAWLGGQSVGGIKSSKSN